MSVLKNALGEVEMGRGKNSDIKGRFGRRRSLMETVDGSDTSPKGGFKKGMQNRREL